MNNKSALFLTASFLVLFTAGCATQMEYNRMKRQHIIDKHPEWTEQEKLDVLAGELKIGMPKEQAIATHWFSSQVNPSDITKTTTIYGTREDWFWLYGGISLHMSFDENGKLDYWSEG